MVDPAPFSSAMPEAVRAELARGRRGEGVTAAWLEMPFRQIAESQALLGQPTLPPSVVGWLAGIAMFGDEFNELAPRILQRRAIVPYVIDAFVAGMRAGVPVQKQQWKGIESLVHDPVDVGLAPVLAIGCASASAATRTVALRLARRLGAPARAAIVGARATATQVAARRLDEALASLAPATTPVPAGDLALLEQLLAAWRETRDPALEPLIRRAGTEVARARGALSARSKGELETRWLALAEGCDAADIDRLLETPWPATWKPALARVTALARLPPDPRIALGVVVRAGMYASGGAQPLHEAVASLILRMPTATLAEPIAAAIVDRGSYYGTAYLRARQAVEEVTPRAAPPALIAAATARFGERAELAALWATHVANPADLAHRAVLADALQVAGDPRGEFIALQLAGGRAAALLAEHEETWFGTIPKIDRCSRRFARGFPVGLRTSASAEALLRTLDDPAWVTIEDLAIETFEDEVAPLIRRLPMLRRLAVKRSVLDAVVGCGVDMPFPRLAVIALATRGDRPWLADRRTFPALKLVACDWGVSRWELEPFRAQQAAAAEHDLVAAYLAFPLGRFPDVLAMRGKVPRETRLVFALDPEGLRAHGWCAKLTRDGGPIALTWCGGPAHYRSDGDQIVDALARANAKELTVHGPIGDAMRASLAKRGVVLHAGRAFDPLEP